MIWHPSIGSVSAIVLAGLLTGGLFSIQLQESNSKDPSRSVVRDSDTDEKKIPEFPPKEDLVKEWQNPDFVLMVSGQLHGYIEPCGCTGLETQKGGLLRRVEIARLLRSRGWNLVPIDTGDQINRIGMQSTLKLQTNYEALCKLMNYQAIGLGPSELKLPGIDLAQSIQNVVEGENPFVSANVVVLDQSMTNRVRKIQQGGSTILVTSVIGTEQVAKIRDADLQVIEPAEALRQIAAEVQQTPADLKVLMVFGGPQESRDMAKDFPLFDVVVSANNPGDPIMIPELIQSGNHVTQVIEVGNKGMHIGLLGVWKNKPAGERLVYERVPVDARFEDFDVVKKDISELSPIERLFFDYQTSMRGLYQNPASFTDIKKRPHPTNRTFVGSEACKDCHEDEFDIWKDGIDGEGGPHFRATLDLKEPGERTWVARNYDPECLSCHVTGWNPQEYFPYESGYIDYEKDAHLHGNGCENCHGPGSQHVAAENGDIDADDNEMEKYQVEMRMLYSTAEKACMECHDLDNSPDFFEDGAFQKYWAKIAHGDEVDNK